MLTSQQICSAEINRPSTSDCLVRLYFASVFIDQKTPEPDKKVYDYNKLFASDQQIVFLCQKEHIC